jgi:spore coat polysaccharide biosynthesis protein SpsF (cytidylyltransferase family)
MKVIAITQARYGSSRFPGKVLKKIHGETLLQIHLRRALKSKLINQLVVATTHEPEAEEISAIAVECGAAFFRGSMDDVLDRFYQAIKGSSADYLVRITSDCPLIDPALMDKVIDYTLNKGLDYCSNTLDPSYPDGQDIEVFKFSALEVAWKNAKLSSEREHVTPYIWKNSSHMGNNLFKSDNFTEGFSFQHLRMTVDEVSDFEVISRMITRLGTQSTWLEYANFLDANQDLKSINEKIERNEGYKKSMDKETT